MTTARLTLPRLHAAQRQVLAGAGKRNVLCCGRRWGKSLFVCGRLIETPGKGLLAGRSVGWFTATNKIADDLIAVLAPRRLTVEGLFNVRGGTHISVRVEHFAPDLKPVDKEDLRRLW